MGGLLKLLLSIEDDGTGTSKEEKASEVVQNTNIISIKITNHNYSTATQEENTKIKDKADRKIIFDEES